MDESIGGDLHADQRTDQTSHSTSLGDSCASDGNGYWREAQIDGDLVETREETVITRIIPILNEQNERHALAIR
jgi:hypothetical protein